MPLGQRALSWLLGGFAAIFALLALGAVWQAVKPPAPNPAEPPPAAALRVGTVAPDFSMPDDTDRPRRLSELDGKPAVLLFLCGCSRCYLMVEALQQAEKQLRGEKPRHLAVTTMTPSEAESWQKRTGFQARFLFETSVHAPVIHQYGGHPCPRVYVLDSQRIIRYVSPSPKGDAEPEGLMAELAAALKVAAPGPDRRSTPAPRRAEAG